MTTNPRDCLIPCPATWREDHSDCPRCEGLPLTVKRAVTDGWTCPVCGGVIAACEYPFDDDDKALFECHHCGFELSAERRTEYTVTVAPNIERVRALLEAEK